MLKEAGATTEGKSAPPIPTSQLPSQQAFQHLPKQPESSWRTTVSEPRSQPNFSPQARQHSPHASCRELCKLLFLSSLGV